MKAILTLFLLAQIAIPADTTEIYYLVFLRSSPDRKPIPEAEGERIQTAHMANIHRLADRGVLIAAGPFEDEPPVIRGIFVFRAGSLDEAKRLAAEDPTVVEHRNVVDVFPWRGPSGIGEEYKRLHKADPKTPEGMGVQPLFMLYRESGWKADLPVISEHREYVRRLRESGRVVADGPVLDDARLAGIVIFSRIPDEEARRLMQADPAVRAGAVRFESHRWWCAANVLPR